MFLCVCGVVCVSGASYLEIFLEQVARKGDAQECRSGAGREQNPGISHGASPPVPVPWASPPGQSPGASPLVPARKSLPG